MEFFSERANKKRERGRVGAASKRADKPNPAQDKSTSERKETKPSRHSPEEERKRKRNLDQKKGYYQNKRPS